MLCIAKKDFLAFKISMSICGCIFILSIIFQSCNMVAMRSGHTIVTAQTIAWVAKHKSRVLVRSTLQKVPLIFGVNVARSKQSIYGLKLRTCWYGHVCNAGICCISVSMILKGLPSVLHASRR